MVKFNKTRKLFTLTKFLCKNKELNSPIEAQKKIESGEDVVAEGTVNYRGKSVTIKTMPLINISKIKDKLEIETNGIVYVSAL